MKRRQKRYTTEESILSEIDSSKQKADELIASSAALEAEAEKNKRDALDIEKTLDGLTPKKRDTEEGNQRQLLHQAKECRERAAKQLKTATRIYEIKLPKLKLVLAAFRTAPMIPITGDDLAVVD